MNLEQARQTFVIEAHDLLKRMEEYLLALETAPDDKDTLDALFRSVHTIKGSAGIFDFEPIVAFAHVVEGVLGDIRNGKMSVDYDLAALLLSCGDHIGALVDCVADRGADPSVELLTQGGALLDQLQTYINPVQKSSEPKVGGLPAHHLAKTSTGGARKVTSDNWHISLRFGPNVLRDGMDPLSFLRYLETLGEIISVTTLFDSMPDAAKMDPESCYLGMEMDFKSDADKETIANVFEFVRTDSKIRILPPHSLISEYIDLIGTLPEDGSRLGELLVNSGALTPEELAEGLRIQQDPSAAPYQEESPRHALIGQILVEEGMLQREIVDGAVDKQKQNRQKNLREHKFVHVQADKLDTLINLVGELVIASAGASLLAQRAGDATLREAMATVSQMVGEIRGGALQLRMVPIDEVFSRFRRVARDLSHELNKEIDLVIDGAETELDKTVIERIGDPLTHLVRNAMDHGIEPADRRKAAGKPEKGTVRLNAFHDSGSIVIEVSDDGAGLDRGKILEKALERGLVAPDQTLSDQEIYNLIFEPGFSTAENVTSLSGRGVGMDVVRRNVEALRGTAEIESREGRGMTVRIRLPLTLAMIDGFLMSIGGASYVVPLDTVVECVELDDKIAASGRDYVNLHGEVLPLLRLREQFREQGQAGRRENVVVVRYAGRKAGLVVDKLLGEFQTVIRPLGKVFGNLKGISGSTILGGGEVALILDVPMLIQKAVNAETQTAAG